MTRQGKSDVTISEDSSSIEFDRDSSPHYKAIAQLQDKSYRETGLTNQFSALWRENTG
ncbi:hypothetical protein QUA00_32195 [Microcoleus sp. T2B6]|uniref:hypothetical protein n=1 Tax=unclassified Microcoleus TaxID=2642155 RepID=UPI002FCE82A9